MPFRGFTEETLNYFLSVQIDNSKSNFERLRPLYYEHVRDRLRYLHEELVPAMLEIDSDICVKRNRCVSGAYNDARYSKAEPVKGYMYLHFCAGTERKEDIPGFFMDASYEGYRFGMQIYHGTPAGMKKLRETAEADIKNFSRIISDIEKNDLFALSGSDYKTDRCPGASPEIKKWLNKKSWLVRAERPADGIFFTREFADLLADGFGSLKPLYLFAVRGLRQNEGL